MPRAQKDCIIEKLVKPDISARLLTCSTAGIAGGEKHHGCPINAPRGSFGDPGFDISCLLDISPGTLLSRVISPRHAQANM